MSHHECLVAVCVTGCRIGTGGTTKLVLTRYQVTIKIMILFIIKSRQYTHQGPASTLYPDFPVIDTEYQTCYWCFKTWKSSKLDIMRILNDDTNMNDVKDLWWRVWWVQALLGGLAHGARMRLVERVGPGAVIVPLWVIRAGHIAVAAAPGAPSTSTATRGVAEPGDGARWNSSVVCVRKVIWRKYEGKSINKKRNIRYFTLFFLMFVCSINIVPFCLLTSCHCCQICTAFQHPYYHYLECQ